MPNLDRINRLGYSHQKFVLRYETMMHEISVRTKADKPPSDLPDRVTVYQAASVWSPVWTLSLDTVMQDIRGYSSWVQRAVVPKEDILAYDNHSGRQDVILDRDPTNPSGLDEDIEKAESYQPELEAAEDCPFDGPCDNATEMSEEKARERFGDMMDNDDDFIVLHADRKTGRVFVPTNDSSAKEGALTEASKQHKPEGGEWPF